MDFASGREAYGFLSRDVLIIPFQFFGARFSGWSFGHFRTTEIGDKGSSTEVAQ